MGNQSAHCEKIIGKIGTGEVSSCPVTTDFVAFSLAPTDYPWARKEGGGGVLDVSLVGEVQRGPSYPDPVLIRQISLISLPILRQNSDF